MSHTCSLKGQQTALYLHYVCDLCFSSLLKFIHTYLQIYGDTKLNFMLNFRRGGCKTARRIHLCPYSIKWQYIFHTSHNHRLKIGPNRTQNHFRKIPSVDETATNMNVTDRTDKMLLLTKILIKQIHSLSLSMLR